MAKKKQPTLRDKCTELKAAVLELEVRLKEEQTERERWQNQATCQHNKISIRIDGDGDVSCCAKCCNCDKTLRRRGEEDKRHFSVLRLFNYFK